METYDPKFEEMKKEAKKRVEKFKQTMKNGSFAVLILLLALILGGGSFYNIGEQEQAIVTTFGVAQSVTEPGLHFKIPIIQRVRKVNTTIQGFAIGYLVEDNETLEDDSLMITSDYNFVNVDFFVEYKVADPVKAVYASEDPFLILLDNIEDPHNLGAVIRTANLAGAHGVIIPKNRAVGLTAAVARTSAGALNYTPVAKVTNLAKTIEELKKQGLWFVCADMSGTVMYQVDLKGPIGLVIGSEGEGVGRLVKEKCDMTAAIPMKGDIDSLNASVAAGVLAFEIVRQRGFN